MWWIKFGKICPGSIHINQCGCWIKFFFKKAVEFRKVIIYCSIRIFELSEFLLPIFLESTFTVSTLEWKFSQILPMMCNNLDLRHYFIWKYLRECLSKGCHMIRVSPVQFNEDCDLILWRAADRHWGEGLLGGGLSRGSRRQRIIWVGEVGRAS